jgi:hypothetical protein
VPQLDAAVGEVSDLGRVRHGHQRVAFGVERAQQLEHLVLVLGVEVAGGLVRQDQARAVDERARHAHALLLAARELRRQVPRAIGEAHALERLQRLLRVGHRVIVLRDHDVFERVEVGEEMELLEDDADLLRRKRTRSASPIAVSSISSTHRRPAVG